MLHSRLVTSQNVANIRSEEFQVKTKTTIAVTIEGKPFELEDRTHTGSEIRVLAGLTERDKLVREEADGGESPVPPARHIHPKPGDNFFVSVRHRRG